LVVRWSIFHHNLSNLHIILVLSLVIWVHLLFRLVHWPVGVLLMRSRFLSHNLLPSIEILLL
jgi:hypothetical protein